MINTVVFDIGNVLVRFDWISYLITLLKDTTIVNIIQEAITKSNFWNEMDLGFLSENELIQLVQSYSSGYEKEVQLVYKHIGRSLIKCDYANSWINELKKKGYRIFYLSNYSKYTIQRNPDIYDFLPLMDGGILSSDIHLLKPDPSIYKALCNKYNLLPANCLFIDDSLRNIVTAQEMGMITYLFSDFRKAYTEINKILVPSSNTINNLNRNF